MANLDETKGPLRVLYLEDSPVDCELVAAEFRHEGLPAEIRRVETEGAFKEALITFKPDLVLSDHALPTFDSGRALSCVRAEHPELPFILVSGMMGEELAVETLKSGATDYILKDRLPRLGPVVKRALKEAKERSDRRRAETALRESEERYSLAIRGAADGIWDWELRKNQLTVSDRWKTMLGRQKETIGPEPTDWFNLVHEDEQAKLKRAINDHVTGRSRHLEIEYRIRHRDGSYRWMLCRGLAVRDSSKVAYRIAGSQSDITDRKKAEEVLLRYAYFDPLTELPNRALFENRLERAIRMARRRMSRGFAVLLMDLDQFKLINDTMGHPAGDILLKAFARRLESLLRPGDTAARFGGDEFTVLLEGIETPSDVMVIASRLLRGIADPFRVSGRDVITTVSMGIVLGSAMAESPDELVRQADSAMYRAKAQGRARYSLFDHSLDQRSSDLLALRTDLHSAIKKGEFALQYQPIVGLATRRILACEALIRWNHPTRGLVSPGDFLPLAEESGLMGEIGGWVLDTALMQVSSWNGITATPLRISVNLSPSELQDRTLVDRIRLSLDRTQFDPKLITLELTESAVIQDPDHAELVLRSLRGLGLRISLDDFGTGYSSLSHVRRFPFSELKIDRSFVQHVNARAEDAALIEAILSIAGKLDLAVVAEGIETEPQREFLVTHECSHGQGYLFSRPLPPDDFERLLVMSK